MPTPPNDDQKLYYSIGEAAERTGVTAAKIRHWDKEFAHLKPTKNRRGERRFTKDNLRELEQIKYLLEERGFTVAGARKEIAAARRGPAGKEEIVASLRGVREKLAGLLE